MRQLNVKVGKGNSIHVAIQDVNGLGVGYIATYCGSGEGKKATYFTETIKNVTCKRCLKAIEEKRTIMEYDIEQ
jgi:hypothetical protein